MNEFIMIYDAPKNSKVRLEYFYKGEFKKAKELGKFFERHPELLPLYMRYKTDIIEHRKYWINETEKGKITVIRIDENGFKVFPNQENY